MRIRYPFWLVLLPVAVTFEGRQARACSLAGDTPAVIDLTVDNGTVPPSAPSHISTEISRGVGPETSGCGTQSASSCDGIGSISLRLSPSTDDRTPAEKLGYRTILVAGTPPWGSAVSDVAVLMRGETLGFHWIDDADDDQEAFDFTVVIVAVDAAGNESDPSEEIRIRHGGRDPGCAVDGTGPRTPTAAVLSLLSLAFLVARRWQGRFSSA